MRKKCLLALVLLLAALCLCSCKENPSGEDLFEKLVAHFAGRGFTCALEPVETGRDVPIYNGSVWCSLKLNGEEVLVYFDESNRADYLSGFVDEERYGRVERFGLRFVLVYAGDDPAVHEALDAMDSI